MLILFSGLGLFVIASLIFIQQPKFGKLPSGERKERIRNSVNYREGRFQNLSDTPQLTGDASFLRILYNFIFSKNKLGIPEKAIPHLKTDLLQLKKDEDIMVWFGHSSYFIQIDGKRILVDPVFSDAASPIAIFNKAFKGANQYTAEDIPDIDYLIITHDHWDHLDYPTIMQLKSRIKKIICGLGVGEHFEYWGIDKNAIIEMDWNEDHSLDAGFTIFSLPARHFSGRGISANQSLWGSFLLKTPSLKIYIGGDSGYDTHFAEIGKRFDGIDLAILENGQYDEHWKYIHMMPYEVLQAAKDLKAKRLFPVHNSKYALAHHDWDAPLRAITALYTAGDFTLLTPKIGEGVKLQDSTLTFSKWWEDMN